MAYVKIVPIYFLFYLLFSIKARRGKDKIDAGKTPRSVGQFWISEIFSKNQHVGLGVSLRGVTNFAKISAKTNLSAKPFWPVYQGLRRVSFIKEKNANKSRMRCGGLVISVPATRSARPGFNSRPGTSPQGGLRGGRSLCEYCTNKYNKH